MTDVAPDSSVPDRWRREASGNELEIALEPGERWWGGAVDDGVHMPFGERPFARALGATDPADIDTLSTNQSAPLLLSSTGRILWSDGPFTFRFGDAVLGTPGSPDAERKLPGGTGRVLRVSGKDVELGRGGSSLRGAFRTAAARFFPPSGHTPARALFSGPQYNSWIEQPYTPTQEGILGYVRGLLDAGLPPGVVMIDDSWSPDYGTWRFDPARFPDPAAMTAQLHEWGCSVMLWLVPFVSPDSATFRDLEARRLLLRDRTGGAAIRRWWNGFSAVLDLSDPDALSWLTGELDALLALGVDGFKFDGADIRDFRADDDMARRLDPAEMCEQWARLGLRYPYNEFRACWRMGGQPLAQRLQDKAPEWGPSGIESLVPELIAQGLIGHPFGCPDMIGGGEIDAMREKGAVDQEFFVRYAQVAALAPMMQFSVSPSRVLDEVHLEAVQDALAVRQAQLPRILALVEDAARSGEPILRPMAYHEAELDDVTDQFFLGPDLLVAPVLTRGATARNVVLPAGRWRADDGALHEGPATVAVDCGLSRIPRFERVPATGTGS